ncbi:hypothetical protein DQ384_31635 [Sphaerisporangium album]|uniref:Enolase C-terminal domain-containing protein n=1 Tax=Sphaerisporangium album TaxID=509200 RepID=A0A367F4X0_9ACTN|nr:hypothetical protein [Sphaerisporangium album]RCG25416.1 hypothetical protein DQ384_31635 [Sphaerisporangium album]
MHQAEDLDVRWFEEPVSSDDLQGLGIVRDAVRATGVSTACGGAARRDLDAPGNGLTFDEPAAERFRVA